MTNTLSTLMVVTGLDRPEAQKDLESLRELLDVPWSEIPVSTVSGEGIDGLTKKTFDALGVIRVYSKQPGKSPDLEQPFTIAHGSTVGDLARTIHKEMAEKFKFARIWGPSAFDGQKVQTSHVLEEGDVVEIHI